MRSQSSLSDPSSSSHTLGADYSIGSQRSVDARSRRESLNNTLKYNRVPFPFAQVVF